MPARNLSLRLAPLLTIFACGGSDDHAPPVGGGGAAGAGTGGASGASGAAIAGAAGARVIVETFGTNLYGADSPSEAERRPALLAAIAAADSDVLCVTDVLREEDTQAIADAAKAAFPHSTWGTRDDKTRADDPRDLAGNLPTAPATAPCSSAAQRKALEEGVACAEMVCSSIPSDPSGHVTSVDCVSSQCSAPLLPLLVGSDDDRRCVSCLEAELASYSSWTELVARCETDPEAGFVFHGQTDTVLLSKHPFVEGSQRSAVLPSSLFRREVLRASIDVGGGLDVYCVHLQTAFSGSLIVYPGPYGAGLSGTQAWAAENRLQAKRVADFVLANSAADRPTVVVGNLESSQQVTSASGALLVSANGAPETLDLLTPTPFLRGVVAGYQPVCTVCPENPLAQIAPPGMWTEHVLIRGLTQANVEATSRGFMEPKVTITGPSGPTMVPLSSHTSLRSTLRLP